MDEETKEEARLSETPPTPPEAKVETKVSRSSEEGKNRSQKMAKQNNRSQQKPRDTERIVGKELARKMRAKMRALWNTMGIEGEFDEAKFEAKLSEIAKANQKNATAVSELDGRAKTFEQENAQLKSKVTELQQKLTKSNRELEMRNSELEDIKIESEIREAAREAGFIDSDYGIELFRRHAKNLPDDGEANVGEFFSRLKSDAKLKHFFRAEDVAAGPKTVAETSTQTQPGQQGTAQGQTTTVQPQGQPKPAAATGKSDEADATTMSRGDFVKHSRSTYGYTPGMA